MSSRRTITQRALRLVAAGAVVAGVMLPAAALAEDDPVYPTPSTTPQVTSPRATPGGSSTSIDVSPSQETLPFTGGEIAGLTLIGLGVTGAGVAMMRIGRRRATT